MNEHGGLVGTLLSLPIFQAEWVLWLLILLSLVSVGIMIERWWFYQRHRVDTDAIRLQMEKLLAAGDFGGAANYLRQFDSLETNIVLFALRQHQRGPDSVEDLLRGAESKEKLRYLRRLSVLATVGSNAPFIGLFGTVLGIIRAFRDLASNTQGIGNSVMFGISEALVATAVGLVVAIPAVVAYNIFTGKLKDVVSNADLLGRTLLAVLKTDEGPVQRGA
jgi:biopolymer transport protein ExbB/TolQ